MPEYGSSLTPYFLVQEQNLQYWKIRFIENPYSDVLNAAVDHDIDLSIIKPHDYFLILITILSEKIVF